MEIRLESVRERDRDILFRLLQYSLFEESISDQNEMNEDALFEYRWFDAYFTDEDREAFFIREQGTDKLLGFAMVNTYMQRSDAGHSIAEFMVIPKYRRMGVGQKAALACFERFKGNWEVSPSYGSAQAHAFWKRVIDAYTGKEIECKDRIFAFSNADE